MALVGFILYKVFFEPTSTKWTENNLRIAGLKCRFSQEPIV
jgi:hypothetical protein